MSELTLRICCEADGDALRVLAERDTARVPAGRVLAAQVGGRIVAAISLDTRRVIADPFLPTADAVELLRRRAAQIRRAERPRLRRRRQAGSSTSPAITGTT